jgi:anthranilate synthase component II
MTPGAAATSRTGVLVMIDNYDSFTFNLVQAFRVLGATVRVFRNNEITTREIEQLEPVGIVISPGPGAPDQAGVSLACIRSFAPRIPILGICLGHQAIAHVLGGRVRRAKQPMHGKVSDVHHRGAGVFADLPSPLSAMRYHSLVVDREGLPPELEVTAWTADGDGRMEAIMGLRHRSWPLEGVQIHPESILTPEGPAMLARFLHRAQAQRSAAAPQVLPARAAR